MIELELYYSYKEVWCTSKCLKLSQHSNEIFLVDFCKLTNAVQMPKVRKDRTDTTTDHSQSSE